MIKNMASGNLSNFAAKFWVRVSTKVALQDSTLRVGSSLAENIRLMFGQTHHLITMQTFYSTGPAKVFFHFLGFLFDFSLHSREL
jgi:hypothetical protein